jgi:predicted nucleic acid-binding protein
MKILLDTNIIIYREDDKVISDEMARLSRILNELRIGIYVHPISLEDLKHDSDTKRYKIMSSKLKAYNLLESPPNPENDENFLSIVKSQKTKINDQIDNTILFAVYKNAVDFLITEDKGLQKKSNKLGMQNSVLTINEAIEMFQIYLKKPSILTPLALKEKPVYNLNLLDPIFDTLKASYAGFEDWWKKISREGRKAWVYFRNDETIGALLISKEEDESINNINPPLPRKKRIKISTLIVSHIGSKIGELFIKIVVQLAQKSNINEIYLTHFIEENDFLVSLIEEYGFINIGKNNLGENVFVKRLDPKNHELEDLSPIEIASKFYPKIYDGDEVNKFIVPIQPKYHNLIFTDFKNRQTLIDEFLGKLIITGNTIKKAYLCHSHIKKIKPGDILLFYRSKDQILTSLGIVEELFHNQTNPEDIFKEVGKRTVYSRKEIENMAKAPMLVILFIHSFHLKKPTKFTELKKWGILNGPPQSITEIDNKKYLKLKSKSIINGSFNVN